MSVTLTPSPKAGNKWRVTFASGKAVDFGQHGASDYTIHKNPRRMLLYLKRHGGVSADKYARAKEWSDERIARYAATRRTSTKEDWKDPHTPGFWSRWLLWSEPTMARAMARARAESGLAIRRTR